MILLITKCAQTNGNKSESHVCVCEREYANYMCVIIINGYVFYVIAAAAAVAVTVTTSTQ